jgi:hypothetical protein
MGGAILCGVCPNPSNENENTTTENLWRQKVSMKRKINSYGRLHLKNEIPNKKPIDIPQTLRKISTSQTGN